MACLFCLGSVWLSQDKTQAQAPAIPDSILSPPETPSETLPPLQTHPLPNTLAAWQDVNHQGDYFDSIQPTPVGYLIWSAFPIKIYVESVDSADLNSFNHDRAQAWVDAVGQAIEAWQPFLPLEPVNRAEQADIQILRQTPPLQRALPENPAPADRPITPLTTPVAPPTAAENTTVQNQATQGRITQGRATVALPRARSAESRYEIFIDRPVNAPAILSHRFKIYLTPNQTPDYTRATARHELGHALGIWGHSPLQTDVLYFSQVRTPPAISTRDINTLKRIYQQPTRLGWQLRIMDKLEPST